MKTLLITTLVVLLSSSLTHARVRRIPIEEMPSKADFVVVGEVIDANCHWDEKGVMIYTEYAIAVQDKVLGQPDSIIFMNFAGGTVDGKSIYVSDTPRLKVSETYLIFGLADEKSFSPAVGHEQGVFRVLSDKDTGKHYIVDYYGNLLEMQDNRKIIRGRPVDLSVTNRLVLQEQKKQKQEKAPVPEPVVRDAEGKVIPQPEGAASERKAGRSGQPLEKDAFINYIIGKVKK